MKAIIELDVPEFQIGQEVSIYFKDTMMIKGIVQAPCDDLISRQVVLDAIRRISLGQTDAVKVSMMTEEYVKAIPSVNPQEPKKCKDCKWWKDSDGAFRRGIGAESKCPLNRIEVYEGNGYCYMFEPQESEDKCKNCKYYSNPDYERCHKCKAESEDKE